jgi:hypothetical protein
MKKLMPLMLPEVFFTDHKLANTTKDGLFSALLRQCFSLITPNKKNNSK